MSHAAYDAIAAGFPSPPVWKAGGDAAMDALRFLQKKQFSPDGVTGLRTGFQKIDQATGGIDSRAVWIAGARPGVGKTAFACQILSHVAGSGIPCAFATFEQPIDQIVLRMALSSCGLSMTAACRNKANNGIIIQALKTVGALPIRYLETPLKWSALRDSMPELQAEGVKLLAIDYIQLLDRADAMRSRVDMLGQITGEMKQCAKEHGIAILALAQINRAGAGGKDRPCLHHLKDAGSIEQDADVVLLLSREEDGGSMTDAGCIDIAKNREGPTGATAATFHGSSFKWEIPND